MNTKYIIKIKGLTQDEQTEFIYRNLTDNIFRLKALLLTLFLIEVALLILVLLTKVIISTQVERMFAFRLYLIAVTVILIFLFVIHYIGNHLNAKRITVSRIIILLGLMFLLAWSSSMKLFLHDIGFQPNLYILILLSVAVVPFLNYWETIIVILPSQLFITIYSLATPHAMEPVLMSFLVSTWLFTIVAILISQLTYRDKITYFKKDLQLTKQNNLLKVHSEVDALTNVYNRRKLDETMDMEWKRSSRTNKPFSFLLIDLDHFKNYNDEYGHIEGDICLRRTAAIMKDTLKRSSDMIFRYGGEEFGVILPFTTLEAANIIAEKLRRNIEKAGISHSESKTGYLTISIGLTASIGNKEESFNIMYIEADKALYAAKRSGRNKVIAFEH